ncbi:EAL domain-containing protein [candidate division KSB3 bacterium]|uniref:EAL domain-containing protein n=1 Tax=candidate division KSB3 bacterium TaxID=2044937 RepID=A0A9D5JTC6_9BACT|nr:EAL domain-containing protein [candidate division KSB3 bacterium]MBD3323646.1 EAL domain-containing protein [candidate division KSB3 bacterium]
MRTLLKDSTRPHRDNGHNTTEEPKNEYSMGDPMWDEHEVTLAGIETFPSSIRRKWMVAISVLDYAFQPIINIHSGVCYGYEALLRNCRAAGFRSILEVFDQAYHDNILYVLDLLLWEKAIQKFTQLSHAPSVKLFFNLDNRVLDTPHYTSRRIRHVLDVFGLSEDALCFEISERHEVCFSERTIQTLMNYRSQGFHIAVDDFGTGFSGLKLFYHTEPDFIKIDRFFIQDIPHDSKKKLFVSNIINIAHLLGSIVIAEGVETELEFYMCKDIGCDLVQGNFVQAPITDITQLTPRYQHIQILNQRDRREKPSDKNLIHLNMEYLPPISHQEDILNLFDIFRRHKEKMFFPVVNAANEPVGIIREHDLKKYTYSLYGKDLLRNPSSRKSLKDFITKIPIAEVSTPVEQILEIFSLNEHVEGILIVDKMRQYIGFLNAQSLLKVLHEKKLTLARDQNPLTQLPGNSQIYEYISQALTERQTTHAFVYFDFDNFKPFNDIYGFRQGDRIILLFADLLKKHTTGGQFIGHVGGDDFFMAFSNMPIERVEKDVARLVEQFRREAESFYNPLHIRKGYILSKDREGNMREFKLLTVSAVILEIPSHHSNLSPESISSILARAKKDVKNSEKRTYIAQIADSTHSLD